MFTLGIMAALAAQSAFALSPVPRDEVSYLEGGAGCTISRAGRIIFITDFTLAFVRLNGEVRNFRVLGNFDHNRAKLVETKPTDPIPMTITIVRRPGAARETEEGSVTPVRLTVGKVVYDGAISCYA